MGSARAAARAALSDGHLRVGGARLYHCAVGSGRPIVVLHGGPEFDHHYLRPELDRLADSSQLVYYDQRGRGRSAAGVRPEDVSLDSEIEDLDGVRRHLGLESMAVLGHSWGGLLAMEYATRHPDRVTHLILADTAPASAADWRAFREALLRLRPAGDVERMRALAAGSRYQSGDLEAEAEYNRIHFSVTLRQPALLEELVGRLRAHFTEESVLLARAIEQRLSHGTSMSDTYDLTPRLQALDVPTLVLHGAHDFIPLAVAEHIAEALPYGELTVLPECGHFTYLEQPEAVHRHVAALLRSE